MWRVVGICFFLFPVIGSATELCPAQINISESAKAIPPGFNIFLQDSTWPRPLIGLDFYDGKPTNLVLEIPEPPDNDDYETTWRFLPTDHIWIVCRYKDSGLAFTHELPQKTTACRVKISDPQNGALTDARLVSSTKCW